MKREIGQQLRKQFERRLIEALPDFRRDQHAVIPQGWRQYSMPFDGERFFVRLVTHPQFDEFTIEMAWSESDSCPVGSFFPRDIPRSNIVASPSKDGQFGFRLPLLWTDGFDCWWALSNQNRTDCAKEMGLTLRNVSFPVMDIIDAVNDAVDRIVKLGIPFLINHVRKSAEQ